MSLLRRLLRRPPPGGRAILLVDTANHVNILRDVAVRLEAAGGVRVVWSLTPPGDRGGAHQARLAVQALGGHFRLAADMLPRLREGGDVLVFCLRKQIDDPPDQVPELRTRGGVRLLQVAEGCRTAYPGVSHPDVPFLGWGGPSAQTAHRKARIVGSPVLEAVTAGPPVVKRDAVALVNFKFRDWLNDLPQRDPPWLKNVLVACDRTGLRPVFSAHPLMGGHLPEGGIAMSDRPVAQLCTEAQVVISRPPSTVVYEALLAGGAQPFLLPTQGGEPLVEFADPCGGAFPLATSGGELATQVAEWQAGGQARYAADAFLDAHLHRDPPRRPAAQRIVDEVRARLAR